VIRFVTGSEPAVEVNGGRGGGGGGGAGVPNQREEHLRCLWWLPGAYLDSTLEKRNRTIEPPVVSEAQVNYAVCNVTVQSQISHEGSKVDGYPSSLCCNWCFADNPSASGGGGAGAGIGGGGGGMLRGLPIVIPPGNSPACPVKTHGPCSGLLLGCLTGGSANSEQGGSGGDAGNPGQYGSGGRANGGGGRVAYRSTCVVQGTIDMRMDPA